MRTMTEWQGLWDEQKRTLLREQWSKASGSIGVMILAAIGLVAAIVFDSPGFAKICAVVGGLACVAFTRQIEGTALSIAIDGLLTVAAAGFIIAIFPQTAKDGGTWIGIVIAGAMMLYWGSKVRKQVQFRMSRLEAFEHDGQLYPMTGMVGAVGFLAEKARRVAVPAPRTAYAEVKEILGAERMSAVRVVCSGCRKAGRAEATPAACPGCGAAEGVWVYAE